MNHPVERALILAEITRLHKQQSEADMNAIYLGITAVDRALSKHRLERIAELRSRLDTLDAGGHVTS